MLFLCFSNNHSHQAPKANCLFNGFWWSRNFVYSSGKHAALGESIHWIMWRHTQFWPCTKRKPNRIKIKFRHLQHLQFHLLWVGFEFYLGGRKTNKFMCVVYCSSEFNKSKTFRLQFRGIAFSISSRRRFGTSKVVFHVFASALERVWRLKWNRISTGSVLNCLANCQWTP